MGRLRRAAASFALLFLLAPSSSAAEAAAKEEEATTVVTATNATMTTTPPRPGETILRLNAGAPKSSRSVGAGRVWVPDAPYLSPGSEEATNVAYYGSSLPGGAGRMEAYPGVYDSERWAPPPLPEEEDEDGVGLGYAIPVPVAGTYSVKLHLAERALRPPRDGDAEAGVGRRTFGVRAEGEPIADGIDVLREAGGPDRPFVYEFDAEVSDGALDLSFVRGTENPMVSGIEVYYRGGGEYDDDADAADADEGYVAKDAAVPNAAAAVDPAADADTRRSLGYPILTNRCGCPNCTAAVWDALATDCTGDFSCGNRIEWHMSNLGMSEIESCRIISGAFSEVCGQCDPMRCRGEVEYLDPVDPSTLIWADEFSVDGPPDPSRWIYNIGGSGWGNWELQYYTDRVDNANVQDGILRIRAVREQYGGMGFTSARIVTRGELGAAWKYGRIQVRARVRGCLATGTWPAIWMLPLYWEYGWWPASGEIDIMEHFGYDKTGEVHATIHTESYNPSCDNQVTRGLLGVDMDAWHTYEVIWEPTKIKFALDGLKYHEFVRPPDYNEDSYSMWPFDRKYVLIINLAVGGTLGGKEGVDDEAFEGEGQVMEVDWVRVYSVDDDGSSEDDVCTRDPAYLEPLQDGGGGSGAMMSRATGTVSSIVVAAALSCFVLM